MGDDAGSYTHNGPNEAITDASKPNAAMPSDSATSPTTESDHCCTAVHSTHSSTHSKLRRVNKAFETNPPIISRVW